MAYKQKVIWQTHYTKPNREMRREHSRTSSTLCTKKMTAGRVSNQIQVDSFRRLHGLPSFPLYIKKPEFKMVPIQTRFLIAQGYIG